MGSSREEKGTEYLSLCGGLPKCVDQIAQNKQAKEKNKNKWTIFNHTDYLFFFIFSAR